MSFKTKLTAPACAFTITLLICATATPPDASAHSAQSPGRGRRPSGRAARTQTPDAQPTPQPAPAQRPAQGGAAAHQIGSSVTIRWRGQPGIERYRLQVARDEGFDDIIFDQAVTGRQHVVSVPAGNYFWRVAPAVVETGRYSTPQPVEVIASTPVADGRSVTVARGSGGWRTATGQVPRPVPVRLRTGGGFDFVGVNTDGMVFAIDGANGVALWTARYKPRALRGEAADPRGALFSPLPVEGPGGRTDVVVAFDAGLRALKGESGVEVWRAALAGRAQAGVVADVTGDGKKEIVATATEPASLVVLDGETGRVISDSKLESNAVGAPAVITQGGQPAIVVGLEGGVIEAWRSGGERVLSVKLESGVTTGPLLVPTPRDLIVVVGGEKGLFALSQTDLKPMGLINTGEDAPRGTLTTADIDGEGTNEVVMVTRGGRVALIGTTDGRVRWVAEGARDADSVSLADLNGDGTLDVIAAAGPVFAHGFSGKDGALIWRVEEESVRGDSQPANPLPRSLAVAPSPSGDTFLVGGDPSRVGLRAVELPKGSVKADLR